MRGDDREHGIGVGAALDGGGAAGGVSEHYTLLHATTMKAMLHHYIHQAKGKLRSNPAILD
jgi:hypothetical protein